MKFQSQYNILLLLVGWRGTYKNHTKTLVIMMSPSISDTRPTMTTICEQKEDMNNQPTKNTTKKYLESPELGKLRVEFPNVSLYNGTSCRY